MTSFGLRPCEDDEHQWSAWHRDKAPGWRQRHCIEPGCPWKEREPIETTVIARRSRLRSWSLAIVRRLSN